MGSLAEAALAAMAGRRAVLIGDLMLDAYLFGETLRVSREAPVVIVRKERTEERLGGAANTAANLAGLGLDVSVVGVVGDDAAGERLLELLRGTGVDVGGVRALAATTATKTRVLAGAPGTSRQQVLRIDEEPDVPLAVGDLDVLGADLRDRCRSADVLAVSDYGVGVLANPTIVVCRRLARDSLPVVVDSRHQISAYRGVTAVTPNVPEAAAAVGEALVDATCRANAGAALLERLGCEACLLTEGRGGMTLFSRGGDVHHVDIVGPDQVTDVTGAGDTVLATFAASLAAGLGDLNGAKLATCAAGAVVSKLGAAAATPAEINAAARAGNVELSAWDA